MHLCWLPPQDPLLHPGPVRKGPAVVLGPREGATEVPGPSGCGRPAALHANAAWRSQRGGGSQCWGAAGTALGFWSTEPVARPGAHRPPPLHCSCGLGLESKAAGHPRCAKSSPVCLKTTLPHLWLLGRGHSERATSMPARAARYAGVAFGQAPAKGAEPLQVTSTSAADGRCAGTGANGRERWLGPVPNASKSLPAPAPFNSAAHTSWACLTAVARFG